MQGSPREAHAHLSVRRISLLFLYGAGSTMRQRSNSPVVLALARSSHHRKFFFDHRLTFNYVVWW